MKKVKFSIRKTKLGVGSICIGASLMCASVMPMSIGAENVYAESIDENKIPNLLNEETAIEEDSILETNAVDETVTENTVVEDSSSETELSEVKSVDKVAENLNSNELNIKSSEANGEDFNEVVKETSDDVDENNKETALSLVQATPSSLSMNAKDSTGTLTDEDKRLIEDFLEKKPVDGDKKVATIPVLEETYEFPGIDEYESIFFTKYAEKIKLSEDFKFIAPLPSDSSLGEVRIKDINSVDFYRLKLQYQNFMYAKNVTFLLGEKEIKVPLVKIRPMFNNQGEFENEYFVHSAAIFADVPVEAADPRFKIKDINQPLYDMDRYELAGTYFGLIATISEDIEYETILEIDENLKQEDKIVVQKGGYGNIAVDYDLAFYKNPYLEDRIHYNVSNKKPYHNLGAKFDEMNVEEYRQNHADFVISQLHKHFDVVRNAYFKDGSLISSDNNPLLNNKYWKLNSKSDLKITNPLTRILKVGIDYTHFVDEDGEEIIDTEFGLNPEVEIAGYKFEKTIRQENGDNLHIYSKVEPPETPVDPKPETPGNPDVSETPEIVIPANPQLPLIPEQPETPETPETPEMAEPPVESETPEVEVDKASTAMLPKTGEEKSNLPILAVLTGIMGVFTTIFSFKKKY
ncbi:YSIRK-type signal peptide-containing protein [Facklamia sp. 7083-14-GEN3]|uniref:YSIRK-type signal peptide-containing protein n=1 Tax=Facklamia sp. 7083-14-GEN3 TaxID=2973478 RepID=UPI00215BD3E8|nr:YSIRK-type signal peptide-containing protein [Facklamia sp. 7083-14-GEN3]MCR8969399.1 YSIRK-type signal peptide-containing protein [Facklamia sp. 7083-14-GEN3]